MKEIAMLLLILLLFSLKKENNIIRIITSIIFGLLSLFMLLAVISEYREFEVGSLEGLKLLLIGSSLFLTTLILSVIIGVRGNITVSY